jgi:hypothetical protein
LYQHYVILPDPEDMAKVIYWLHNQAYEFEEWQKQENEMYSKLAKKAKKQ